MEEITPLQNVDNSGTINEQPPVITVEDAKRQHDYHLAQVHFWRKKLGYAPIITRSAHKRLLELSR